MTDNINHPRYYAEGWSNNAEVIDITENLNFNLGNVVKYVARAGRKTGDPAEDLQKAEWYLFREIQRLDPVFKPRAARALEEPRVWDLLDHVPPNTIVVDKDGDRYRRVNGTAKFEISCIENEHGQYYEWQPAWLSIYHFGPFTEVKDAS
jgi:hypothetical protein